MLENHQGGTEPPRRSFIETMRRAQLVGCAIETIAELGAAQASLVKIADRAGVSRGVISYHFADRDELIAQAVSEVYERGQEFVGPLVADEASAADKLRAFILGSVSFYEAYPLHISAFVKIREHARDSAESGRLEPSPPADMLELEALEALLRQGQREGDFRECSVSVVALTIRKALDGAVAHVQATGEGAEYARELADLFSGGLRGKAGDGDVRPTTA